MELGNLMYPQGGDQPLAETPPPEKGFTEKLRSDPAMLQSMMMAGARLMQGVRPGEAPMAAFGDALMIGNATHQMLSENQRKAELDAQEASRRNALSDANIGQAQASTAKTQQDTAQSAANFPETQKKLALEVKQLTAAGRRDEALAKINEFKSDPARMAQAWNLDLEDKKANISQSQAAAGASGASAEAARANAELTRTRAGAAGKLMEEGQYGSVLHGSPKVGAGAAKDQLANLHVTLKAAYPEASEQEIAKMALDMSSSKKGETLESLKALLDYGTEEQRKYAQDRLYEQAAGGKSKPPAAAAAQPAGAVTLPPLASRKVGAVYPTPKGQMKWTAEGWVQP